ncbi:MAG: ABC transporter ATP-binding protein [Streptococcus vestibularis]|jgi:ABC transporter, ATP-binding protein|uniref:ABC transporter ATP-binding protein n=2 Tax=Streptococcus TaxID=1301 RepID=A0A1R3T5L1_STRSL|nr:MULTISPECIES: ABC transporter ATP-binding protein [Streptococcaceae]MBS6096965.1 ABC transporter ATP-binding protein [Streptococcus vestibularis]MDM7511066.1 ABC transporter ATP-binding protein [Lactococcus lactis]MDM7652294.1 ABC transporter ATP-binding protein [Lactococcus lactis]SCW20992.1 ABC transporter ATP-binding protein [Streptococcus salivarius]
MISFNHISKTYQVGDQEVKALDDVSFSIEKGKFTVILGPSGSGKSTLLNLLGGMDRATEGSFVFDNKEITSLNDNELSIYRQDIVGFVFQFYNLIPSLTALENINIAAQLTGNVEESEIFLDKVGLSHRKNNFPNQLSGGEMQRVSIARALAKKPKLLLCDEPTGALDSKTGQKIIELLQEASKDKDVAVVMVTHNAEFKKFADKVIYLKDGKINSIIENQDLD